MLSEQLSSSKIEIPHALVAHRVAKFSCCAQYCMFGPDSHRLDSFPEVCVSIESWNTFLNLTLIELLGRHMDRGRSAEILPRSDAPSEKLTAGIGESFLSILTVTADK